MYTLTKSRKARYSYFICSYLRSQSGGVVNLDDLRHRMKVQVAIDYTGHKARIWDTVMTAIDWLIVDLSAGEPETNYLSYYSIGDDRFLSLHSSMDERAIGIEFGTHGELLDQGGE